MAQAMVQSYAELQSRAPDQASQVLEGLAVLRKAQVSEVASVADLVSALLRTKSPLTSPSTERPQNSSLNSLKSPGGASSVGECSAFTPGGSMDSAPMSPHKLADLSAGELQSVEAAMGHLLQAGVTGVARIAAITEQAAGRPTKKKKPARRLGCDLLYRPGDRVHVRAVGMGATVDAPLLRKGAQKGRYRVRYDDGSSYHVLPADVTLIGKDKVRPRAHYHAGDRVIVVPGGPRAWRARTTSGTVVADLRHTPCRVDGVMRVGGVLVRADTGATTVVDAAALRAVKAFDPDPLRVGESVRVDALGGAPAVVASALNTWGKHRGAYKVRYADGSTYHVKRRGLTRADRRGYAVGDAVWVPAVRSPAVIDALRNRSGHSGQYRVRYASGRTYHLKPAALLPEPAPPAQGQRPRGLRVGDHVHVAGAARRRGAAVIMSVSGGRCGLYHTAARVRPGSAQWHAPASSLTRVRATRAQRRAEARRAALGRERSQRAHRARHAARDVRAGDAVYVWAVRQPATVEKPFGAAPQRSRCRVRYADGTTYHVRAADMRVIRRARAHAAAVDASPRAAARRAGAPRDACRRLAAGTRVAVLRTHAEATVCAPGLIPAGERRGTYRVMYDDGSTAHVKPRGLRRTRPVQKQPVRVRYSAGDRVLLLGSGEAGTVGKWSEIGPDGRRWFEVALDAGGKRAARPEALRLQRAHALHSPCEQLAVGARVWVRATCSAATVSSRLNTRGLHRGRYQVRYADGSTYHVKPRGLVAIASRAERKALAPGALVHVRGTARAPLRYGTATVDSPYGASSPGTYCVRYRSGATYHVKPRHLVPLSAPAPLRAGDVVCTSGEARPAVVDRVTVGGVRLRLPSGAARTVAGRSAPGDPSWVPLHRVAKVKGRYVGPAAPRATMGKGDAVHVVAACAPAVVAEAGATRLRVRYADGTTHSVARAGAVPLRAAMARVAAAARRAAAQAFAPGDHVTVHGMPCTVVAPCGAVARAVGLPSKKGTYAVATACGVADVPAADIRAQRPLLTAC